jgi:hypothetical protein
VQRAEKFQGWNLDVAVGLLWLKGGRPLAALLKLDLQGFEP